MIDCLDITLLQFAIIIPTRRFLVSCSHGALQIFLLQPAAIKSDLSQVFAANKSNFPIALVGNVFRVT